MSAYEHKEYDRTLLGQIRNKLHFPPRADIKKHLQQRHISCEELLAVILGALLPFSQMLKDLLKMFEDACAQQTVHNLRIEFDFSKYDSYVEMSLDQFKQQVRSTEKSGNVLIA